MRIHEPTFPGIGGDLFLPRVLLEEQTASSSATIDFTGLTDYRQYIVEINDLIPATDAVDLYMRFSQDNGSTFLSGASDYAYGGLARRVGGATTTNSSTGAAQISINREAANLRWGTAANESGAVSIRLLDLGDAAHYPTAHITEVHHSATTNVAIAVTGGRLTSLVTINAVRFLFSSGDISTGRFRLYGVLL